MLTDYGMLAPEQRNILRLVFLNPRVRAKQTDWEGVARFVVAGFRVDAARAGAGENVRALVQELSLLSPEFAEMWRETDIRAHFEGAKYLQHPSGGMIALEFSAFAVDGRPDLGMVVYNPATPQDEEKVRALIKASEAARKAPAEPA